MTGSVEGLAAAQLGFEFMQALARELAELKQALARCEEARLAERLQVLERDLASQKSCVTGALEARVAALEGRGCSTSALQQAETPPPLPVPSPSAHPGTPPRPSLVVPATVPPESPARKSPMGLASGGANSDGLAEQGPGPVDQQPTASLGSQDPWMHQDPWAAALTRAPPPSAPQAQVHPLAGAAASAAGDGVAKALPVKPPPATALRGGGAASLPYKPPPPLPADATESGGWGGAAPKASRAGSEAATAAGVFRGAAAASEAAATLLQPSRRWLGSRGGPAAEAPARISHSG
eukprot:CAMPEP_0179202378 /NCGR_PEP_ID=MMETSP0796-20121207/100804_1 /TAXON_ID=73915 /ORGANISM="Pyrodinium bahamense, Strain pbaha01" /LENGTH=294 /DNA_ID=CAMNT_0020907097 /DNA_START=84 /DNA_END=965 /DNA_ORIENTATION=+